LAFVEDIMNCTIFVVKVDKPFHMLKLDITFLLAATVQTPNKDATTHWLYGVMKDFVLPVVA